MEGKGLAGHRRWPGFSLSLRSHGCRHKTDSLGPQATCRWDKSLKRRCVGAPRPVRIRLPARCGGHLAALPRVSVVHGASCSGSSHATVTFPRTRRPPGVDPDPDIDMMTVNGFFIVSIFVGVLYLFFAARRTKNASRLDSVFTRAAVYVAAVVD